jgi:hypothetical protein
MVEETVSQLVGKEPHEHGPGDLVPPPPANDIALLDLDDLGILRIDAGDAGAEKDPVAPILYSGDQ